MGDPKKGKKGGGSKAGTLLLLVLIAVIGAGADHRDKDQQQQRACFRAAAFLAFLRIAHGLSFGYGVGNQG